MKAEETQGATSGGGQKENFRTKERKLVIEKNAFVLLHLSRAKDEWWKIQKGGAEGESRGKDRQNPGSSARDGHRAKPPARICIRHKGGGW